MGKNILIIGSGGREHALAWKLNQSKKIGRLYVAPGNGGTRQIAVNIPIEVSDIDGLAQFVRDNNVALTIVGPEGPLAAGIVDNFQAKSLRIFGPTRAAVQIEASKAFAKQFMLQRNIPTAPFRIFRKYENALAHLREGGAPVVVKASGLALGKGVYPCRTLVEAEEALKRIMVDRVHKNAGNQVVIEEFLEGQEVSIHAFCDGKTAALMPTSQDHKAIFDGDKGPNTGGMGTFAPVPWVTDSLLRKVKQKIVEPTLKGLNELNIPYVGCLYPGLMVTSQGPMVLEYNARFGDPELQSYIRLLKTDLLEIIEACVEGRLADLTIEWDAGFVVCVVIASGGYPGKYTKGIPIEGINEAEQIPGIVVFHAGTAYSDKLRTNGGRVFGVTAIGDTLPTAIDRAYVAVRLIRFEGMQYRKDIGVRALYSSSK